MREQELTSDLEEVNGKMENQQEDQSSRKQVPGEDAGLNGDLTTTESDPPNLMAMAVVVEGGMVVLALVIGWFGFCDSQQSLLSLGWNETLFPALVWGVGSVLPLLAMLYTILYSEIWLFQSMRATVEDQLVPLFKDWTWIDMLVLSLLAGFGEEIFFRWCLQGGVAEMFSGVWGNTVAVIAIGVLFGLCHYLNLSYAIITAAIGIYLGWVMVLSGTYLAPALAHAIYDFVALCLIVRMAKKATEAGLKPEKA